jgi:RecB family exonuclease
MHIEFLSASRGSTYRDCPFKYFLQHHIKLPELREPTIHTDKGVAVHEVLEKYGGGDKNTEENLRNYYTKSKLWTLDDRRPDKGFPHPWPKSCDTCPFHQMADGLSICKIAGAPTNSFEGCPRPNFEDDIELVNIFLQNPKCPLTSRKIIAVEKEFKEEFEGFRVRGYIDLITEIDSDTLEVRDYKTGRSSKSYEQAEKDIQLRLYSLVAKRLYPSYKYVLMTLDYLRKKPISLMFGPEDEEKTILSLRRLYNDILNDENPERKKNWLCNYCVGYDECGKIREKFLDSKGKFKLPIYKEDEEQKDPTELV